MSNVTFTISDTGASQLPNATGWSAGTFRPAGYFTNDSFPAPGPGTTYSHPGPAGGNSATFSSTFGGTAPNGTWNLFIVAFESGDFGSISGGWTLEIVPAAPTPTPTPVNDAVGDFDADGKTDYSVIRSGGSIDSPATWFVSFANFSTAQVPWGLSSDIFVPLDFNGDSKDDYAIWRPGPQGTFYILLSGSNTVVQQDFGIAGDDPTVVGDYNNDNVDELAVWRKGATPTSQSTFYWKSGANFTQVDWGLGGDFPAPGDYDGDNKLDYAVQRNVGGNGVFFIKYSSGIPDSQTTFGLGADAVVPGDFDKDGKSDLCVVRAVGGFWQWTFRPSGGGGDVTDTWGIAATDDVIAADFDGDGQAEYAVWRPGATAGAQSTFFAMTPVARKIYIRDWGLGSDVAVTSTFVH